MEEEEKEEEEEEENWFVRRLTQDGLDLVQVKCKHVTTFHKGKEQERR